MAFNSSQKARIILGDFPLSSYVTKFAPAASIPLLDTTVLTSTGEEGIPGDTSGKVDVEGLFDSLGTAVGQNQQMFSQLAAVADDVVSAAPAGFALGNPTISALVVEDSYGVSNDPKSAVSWKLQLMADGGIWFGLSLADLAQVAATTNGTGLDNTASTANGGIGFLHVTQYAGFTNVVFKVQHSTDNSSWSDLGTFTTVTAIGSQRVVVAAGTTVNRYLRALATVSGAGTVTYQMSFARNVHA